MARITVNQTGTNPTVLISTTVSNAALQANGNITGANVLSVTCLQDITITSSTGIYSYVDFCSKDINKLTTPADNQISMNIVIDPTAYFGSNAAANTSAAGRGIANISQNKVPVQFLVVWNSNDTANIVNGGIANLTGVYFSSGQGYVSSLAPTASPDAPVFVTPISIAVDGTMYTSSSDIV